MFGLDRSVAIALTLFASAVAGESQVWSKGYHAQPVTSSSARLTYVGAVVPTPTSTFVATYVSGYPCVWVFKAGATSEPRVTCFRERIAVGLLPLTDDGFLMFGAAN